MRRLLLDALLAALIAGALALPILGVQTQESPEGPITLWKLGPVLLTMLAVGLGRFLVIAGRQAWLRRCSRRAAPAVSAGRSRAQAVFLSWLMPALLGLAILLPFFPFTTRYALDVAIMVMTYVMLASGLTITLGYAGLLDLGFAAFYGLGAYAYALLALKLGIGFWSALPLVALLAAFVALVIGVPVLRLRGDYFAIVTLGFGEIFRLLMINLPTLTGGPAGLPDIPRPSFLGLVFTRAPQENETAFHAFFGMAFDPLHRVYFFYALIFLMMTVALALCARLRRLPFGRAWEAFREDETACAALGISGRTVKLSAYMLAAGIGALAGAFFAARQGFISPESFTFQESSTLLAIVILGGMGHVAGIVLATLFVIGVPELFRELENYRMLAFGAGMVAIMLLRPGGLMATRDPSAIAGAARV